jgi:hypothetical protein
MAMAQIGRFHLVPAGLRRLDLHRGPWSSVWPGQGRLAAARGP